MQECMARTPNEGNMMERVFINELNLCRTVGRVLALREEKAKHSEAQKKEIWRIVNLINDLLLSERWGCELRDELLDAESRMYALIGGYKPPLNPLSLLIEWMEAGAGI